MTSKAANAARYPQTAGTNICGEDIKNSPDDYTELSEYEETETTENWR